MFFKVHTGITAVMIQSNKIVSNEVRQALLKPSYGKKLKELFGQPNKLEISASFSSSSISFTPVVSSSQLESSSITSIFQI